MKTSNLTRLQMARLEKLCLPVDRLEGLHACTFSRGEHLCVEGAPLVELFIILKGRARISHSASNGRCLLLGFDDGEGIVGDLELFTGRTAACTDVQAATDVSCVAVPLARNRERLLSDAAFLAKAGGALAAALERSTQNCARIILCPLEARLCSYIGLTARDGVFSEKLTETSELLGVSYRHLLRALRSLCDGGILSRDAGGYRILNAERLWEIAEE